MQSHGALAPFDVSEQAVEHLFHLPGGAQAQSSKKHSRQRGFNEDGDANGRLGNALRF